MVLNSFALLEKTNQTFAYFFIQSGQILGYNLGHLKIVCNALLLVLGKPVASPVVCCTSQSLPLQFHTLVMLPYSRKVKKLKKAEYLSSS